MSAAVLWPIAGIALLLLLLGDLVVTVFHPEGRGGPINRVQNRLIWRCFRAVAGCSRVPGDRGRVLVLCGPVLAVSTITGWGLLLVAGFALVYFPSIPEFVSSAGPRSTAWLEALYFSTSTASTLGLGDLVPPTAALRVATVVESACGFILFALAVTYVLSIYRELGHIGAVAEEIHDRFRPGADAIISELEAGDRRAVLQWSAGVGQALRRIARAHLQYPILRFFRVRHPSAALPIQLGKLLDFVEALEHRSDGTEGSRATHPSIASLAQGAGAYVAAASHESPAALQTEGESVGEIRRQHAALLRYLCYPSAERSS